MRSTPSSVTPGISSGTALNSAGRPGQVIKLPALAGHASSTVSNLTRKPVEEAMTEIKFSKVPRHESYTGYHEPNDEALVTDAMKRWLQTRSHEYTQEEQQLFFNFMTAVR